jgi:peroxiredoxin
MKKQILFLSFVFCPLILDLPSATAQGFLPPNKVEISTADANHSGPSILVGDTVPATLTVTDSSGTTRSLLSYKTPLDVLVLGFFSARCPANVAAWHDLKLFYEAYKDWRVAFVAISANQGESLDELAGVMQKAGLPYTVVRDENQRVAIALHAKGAPEIMIVDESKVLRYRGSLRDAKVPYARQAMDAVIGHSDPVPNAEPGTSSGCPIQ